MRTSLGELPADYVPLAQRCKELMAATHDLCYAGITPDHLEGVYIERTRVLGILDKYIAQMDASALPRTVALLKRLAGEVESPT